MPHWGDRRRYERDRPDYRAQLDRGDFAATRTAEAVAISPVFAATQNSLSHKHHTPAVAG